ncbi:GYD domain-containing protein [Mesorhizobium sp. 131-2-1]|uniref:GYD domain-containing protein n=1 Tax=Mesorhizobium sp. 131-2-1 TaxID=2744518 RepID=UPI001928DB0B|nr:GYD domain-containing protein [Mesorhizobium sp. 131-2-1]BCG96860.1 GYD domain-containing protein [Mesorhizobium sp. 131-2-1]
MPTFIVTGCYSATAAMGMIDNPSNREKAARAIFEAAGGKLHTFYVTTGETDWLAITEFDDGVDLLPALLVVGASGAVSNVKTVRAYTSAEFKAAQEKAGKIASSYRSPAR